MREDKVKEHTFQTVPAYLEILKIVRPMIKYGKENSLELHPIFLQTRVLQEKILFIDKGGFRLEHTFRLTKIL